MAIRFIVRFAVVLCVAGICTATLSAQNCNPCPQATTTQATPATPSGNSHSFRGELYLNAGGIWPTRIDEFDNNKIKSQGVYGLKGGGGLVPDANGNLVPNPASTRIIHDGDTFFTANYGGGIKAMNLWGPLGFRADFRGRTIPNFHQTSPTWPEITGGVLFSWGEQ